MEKEGNEGKFIGVNNMVTDKGAVLVPENANGLPANPVAPPEQPASASSVNHSRGASGGPFFNGHRAHGSNDDSHSSDSSSSSGESCDENEDPESDPSPPGECFFCEMTFTSDEFEFFLYDHILKHHSMDIAGFRKKFDMDQISYIQMVNYFRKEFALHEKPADEKKINILELFRLNFDILAKDDIPRWNKEIYLKPVIEDDPMLSFFFESVYDKEERPLSYQLEIGTIPHYEARVRELEKQLKDYHEQQCNMDVAIYSMRSTLSRAVLKEEKEDSQGITRKRTSPEAEGYFESYDEVGIHASMLGDKPRTSAYRDAFYFNRTDFENKIVLDCGCGTGILSFFSIRSGASQVYAVDQSKIIYEAMHIATENRMDGKIKFIPGKIESIEINGKVDILISEFMGYFLLFEGMLSSYLTARDRFLKNGGLMFPNLATINISGYDNEDKYDQIIGMWDDVYGVTMSAMKKRALAEPLIEHVKESEVATSTFNLLGLDLTTCAYEDAVIDKTFGLMAKRDTKLVALVGYFDVSFTQGSSRVVTLSTSPDSPLTHWNQCIFFLEKPIKVTTGEWVSGRFICKPSNANPRSLEVQITIGDNNAHYEFR